MKILKTYMTSHSLYPETWVDQYADYLFNYAVTRVSDSEIAKDIVQETFFAGLKSAKNFKGDAAERTWLVAILKRKVIDHYRKINSNKGKAEVRIRVSYTRMHRQITQKTGPCISNENYSRDKHRRYL